MKKFTFLLFTVFLFFSFVVSAQQRTSLSPAESSAPGNKPEKRIPVDERCATMQHLEDVYRQNPSLKQANELLLQQLEQNRGSQQGNSNQRLNAIVTIPVVFHIVLPNPYIITDADIQAQLDRLNFDFSGLNADSANVPAEFQAVRGHSQIRFCLAQRTPGGLPTNGIERRASSTTYTGGGNDPIKVTASGGLDAWDFTQYMNVWVGGGGGLLGYATFPGTSTPAQQGVVTDIIGTSNNPCYVNPDYNLGRTMTHEVGHYLGLFHIWGDEGGCTNSDFRNLGGTCVISDVALAGTTTDQAIGDTPNMGDQNFGCPSGNVTNSCSPNPPGDMYQNYMDYTDDACMTMFTIKQALRMEWVIANCRAGYITSPGCLPPASGPSLDASPVAIINPGGSEVGTGCSVTSYPTPFCPGTLTPRVRITNNGLNTMTSVTVGSRIGTGPATTNTITGLSIAGGQTAIVNAPAVTLTVGANVLKLFTSNPNGIADPIGTNDTISTTLNISGPTTIPAAQNFDNPALAPWTIQTNGTPPVWQLAAPAGIPPSSPTNVTSAVINHYDFDGNGKHDDIRSPIINTTGLSSLQIRFDVAYSPFSATFVDSFVVLISKDCGATYTEVYRKGGTTLATKPGFSTTLFTPANTGEWRNEVINLGPADLTGSLFVVFRSIAGFGNRLWLDNINIANPPFVDMVATTIGRPNTFECGSFAPSLTVRNSSNENVNAFKVGYILDGGAPVIQALNTLLTPTATSTVSFPAISPAGGTHTIKLFVADPLTGTGTLDASKLNDTLTRTFNVPTTSLPSVVQGFEGTTFVPAGWVLLNPNNNATWTREAPGKTSGFSAFIDNYNNPNFGQVDMMQTPPVNTVNADAVTISFDVAHKNYPGSFDQLRVLVSTDCGTTFTSVYSKSGATLATAGSTTDDFRDPTDAQWRNEVITLNSSFMGGNLLVQFENSNDYGNNIYIDNI
ncbi:MAG TPA: choice-of-anchor J domain-containing protein, partial [Chitinophagaceae bacterium]